VPLDDQRHPKYLTRWLHQQDPSSVGSQQFPVVPTVSVLGTMAKGGIAVVFPLRPAVDSAYWLPHAA